MFSDNLKRWRQYRQLSQKSLAEKIGVSQQALARWEIDTSSPNPEMIASIAKALDIPVAMLFDDGKTDESMPPATVSDDEAINTIADVIRVETKGMSKEEYDAYINATIQYIKDGGKYIKARAKEIQEGE